MDSGSGPGRGTGDSGGGNDGPGKDVIQRGTCSERDNRKIRRKRGMGRVILISSGKGGTGKTMFTVNMGLYWRKGGAGSSVDMDMGLRNLDIYLGWRIR